MNYTIGVDTSKNLYTFDFVNCFEKPLGLILSNEEEVFQSLFYIYLKMLQSYSIRGFDDPSVFYTVSFNDALVYIIGKKLGFEIMIEEAGSYNLHQIIRGHLDEGRAALVPGNLRELPYSDYYQTSDWKHLFLVNGYNEEKEVYSVIDSKHEKNVNVLRYEEFSFKYKLIEQLFTSAKEKLNVASIWSIYRKEETERLTEKELLKDVFDLLLNHKMEQPYKELDYIQRINKEIDEGFEEDTEEGSLDPTTKTDFIFLRAVKYKDTFYNELLNVLVKFPINPEYIERFKWLKTGLYMKWTDVINNTLVYRCLKQKVEKNDKLVQALKQEEEISRLLHLIRKELD